MVAAPSSGPARVVVHIGMGKTGTSSVQYLLAANRDVLTAHGVLFPRVPGRARHTRLGLAVKPDDELTRTPAWHRIGQPIPRRFRRRFRRKLLAEIAAAEAHTVLFSDEALWGLNEEALLRLRELVAEIGGRVRVVAYLRRQDDHLASLYQQEVKVGETRRIDEWVSLSGLAGHDYHARLSAWRDLFGPDELVVRRFERSAFVDGSLYADFLDAAGIDIAVPELAPAETRNPSLDAETIEFLRILNLHRVGEGAESWLINNLEVVERLRQHEPGETLTLPDATLDRVVERWQDSNRATARDFLGDPDGVLFREPRRHAATITEQRLDPARVDYFARLVGLSADVSASLRDIAARDSVR
ncbi:hypothetical protein SFC88_19880 [Nocardioides sp. HM23]|uniref:hypothetical protein n=1 Tax=Nocardioides bizhenqiangii TaxID=3095076 RepID=UPI002ACA16BB|nr:hypothetical protein [Nocardioides sp. HM23]MDZ5623109.1 hypothetical protein [Nocardioides sp. HM23]